MESAGLWRKYTVLMFHFLAVSSGERSSANKVNVSHERPFADFDVGQHTLPSWYNTSADAVPKHGTVRINSQNRWQPQMVFSKTVYSFEVTEDTLPGTVVGKVETTLESLTPITYTVQEDDGENLFLLGSLSGDFLLSRGLDFEAQRFYILTVAAWQGDSPVSSVRVYFNTLDVNDNPPVFSQSTLTVSLPEDTRADTCFLAFNVSDKDAGENGALQLKVISGDEEEVFFINPTGSLCLGKELDRERRSSYNLTVTANDCTTPLTLRLTSTAQVNVVVEDVNDNAPVFLSASRIRIPEDAALRSVVTTLHSEDADSGSNGEVLYYLNNTSVFSIDSRNGVVYLEEALDREQRDRLTVIVTAADKGSPRMSATMNLTVDVEDANDHNPEFSQVTYNVTVKEGAPRGTDLCRVQAHDRDIGRNGQVRYALTPESPFAVDAVRGLITVMEKLDRERESNYTLVVTAMDRGDVPRSTTSVLSVTVLDVNDFAPLFKPDLLIVRVTENEANLSQQVAAVDEDLGVNSQLTYFIQQGDREGLFSITLSGMFQISYPLDREKDPLHSLTIIAVDSGLPPLTGTLTIQVVVEDLNDNPPEFAEEVYTTIVSEDSPAGTVFAMITASDVDEGLSGEIRYFMENLDTPFSIEETSGELLTTDVLDREQVAVYNLTVTASDKHPTLPLSSSVLVTVLVGDINDHWPQFMNSPYVAYVPSAIFPGSVVCAVRATDGDIEVNADLHYSLYGQGADLFSIDPYRGIVFTSKPLMGGDDLIVNVLVEDAGETPKFATSTISIRFQNVSHFPEINTDILGDSLSEDEPTGTSVAVISAASSRAEPVLFFLTSGNYEDVFHVEQQSGVVTVENLLDYENRKEFTLLIEARDSGSPPFSSYAEIHINISDINDNAPQFTQPEYRCEVLENSPPTWVCDVFAIDADSGSYGTLQYNITQGNADHAFTVDPENGMLSTTRSLDRERISEFNLTIEAVEIDNPLHKDTATVIVIVLDRNDNAPRFSQIYMTEVSEDSPIGHTFMRITSADDDAGANAVINYAIIDQNVMPFSIDAVDGYITVSRLLDREMQSLYILRVMANDSAWSVSTDVTIVITDVNDNTPDFSDAFYFAVIPETKDEDVFVLQVLATDADVQQNGEIAYVIEPPNEHFWVNTTSGNIYTKQPLTLNNFPFDIYEFVVFAFDGGSDPLCSNTSVTVRLEPYNYNAPVFSLSLSPIPLPYHLPVNTQVAQITAVDPDVSNSSTDIEYGLTGGNASDFFWIHSDNGTVTLNQSLTKSMNTSLTLIVWAKDRGCPSLSSQTEITFKVTLRNQFSPSFKEADVAVSVPEDLPVGSVLRKIQAEDGDDGPNGVVMYGITSENQYLPFAVGEASGLLTLITELDFEKESIYHFQIIALDGGWFSKTAALNVTVIIMDVNDNPPIFPAPEYFTSVPENSAAGTNVLTVKAKDEDSGANAQITYSLIAEHVDKFAIDSRNGTITTLDVFDCEREQIFYITVKASNTGGPPLFSLTHVVIQISDVNEFPPTFTDKKFSISVPKSVPIGSKIGKVTAVDDDGGSEGQVLYLMFGQNKHVGFEIDHLSGVIYTTASLRKQGNSDFFVKILAKNSGVITGRNIDEAVVQIHVIETNDAPIFTSELYTVNISEDSVVGTSLLTVNAQDQDSILDWNRFYFTIQHGGVNSIDVDPSSGVISLIAPLDRERWPVYNLTITATDLGSPPATGTTTVIVTVWDVNDNAPELTFTEAQVKENLPQSTVVARLNASDRDLPPNQGPFTFRLVNNSAAFSLTADGVLSTLKPPDREHISAYRLLVAVRDAGSPPMSSTTTFHIRITDENDNPPLPRNIFIEVKYFGSSFEGGMIGNVHPEDQDESDIFNCAIKSGSMNMFIIPNGTCELWSSPFKGEATFNITIEATDQLHFPVNNSIYVNYKGFTNATMDSGVLFYVSSSSMEELLSHKYLRFVKALDSLFNLQASKTHVFGIKHIGSEILLLAAVKNYNGQYLSREVASRISAGHKKLLEYQSNMTISHITSDPCLANPCRNGATCNKNIYISQDVAVLESSAVIFVSPSKEILNCTCPTGFSGSLCEDDVDECEMSPCKNEATCVNTLGGFHCHCPAGFLGSVCSSDVDECLKLKCQNGGSCMPTQDGYHCLCGPGYEGETCEQLTDHCRSSPCVQGSCVNSNRGFSCLCPFGVSGIHCEEPSYGFDELSFMEFPSLDRRTNLISLEFATVQKNSLLLYNHGGASSRDFFALEILNGSLRLSFELGSGPVRLRINKQVADGHFHSITARRIGSMGSLRVDNCTDIEGDGFCFSQSDGSSSERTLDVSTTNLTFGGMRTAESILQHPLQIKTHYFVGCVRKVQVNGVLLRPSMALAAYNVLDRCPRTYAPPCHRGRCKNGGECRDVWSDYLCVCQSPFTGRNCDKEISQELVVRFEAGDYIEYVVKERFKRDYLLDGKNNRANKDQRGIDVKFKTQDNGVLMFVFTQTEHIILEVRDRKPVYVSKDIPSGRLSEFIGDTSVADGVWHVLNLSSNRQNTSLSVDGKVALSITDRSIDLTPTNLERIILGSAPKVDSMLQQSGFAGCMQFLNVLGHSLPVSGYSEMADIWPSPTLIRSGCGSPDLCVPSPCTESGRTCLSADCQNWWKCSPLTQNGSCICLHNVSAHVCDICGAHASESGGRCSKPPDQQLLWLIAVILPVVSFLLITGMAAALYRTRQPSGRMNKSPEKSEKGADNVAFSFDNGGEIKDAERDERGPASDNQQRSSVGFYCDAGAESAQPLSHSELEYYEISSICSAFHSDAASLELSWNKRLCSPEHAKAEPKGWGDLKMLLAGFKSGPKPPDGAPQNKQMNQKTAPERFLPSELTGPVQHLTFEEISKLNSDSERQREPAKSPGRFSSDSETDSTFTCSEWEYGQLSAALHHEEPLCLSVFPVSQTSGQREADASTNGTFDQWGNILNMNLPFSAYAPVFEDMACLPIEPSQSCDVQSDIEEII